MTMCYARVQEVLERRPMSLSLVFINTSISLTASLNSLRTFSTFFFSEQSPSLYCSAFLEQISYFHVYNTGGHFCNKKGRLASPFCQGVSLLSTLIFRSKGRARKRKAESGEDLKRGALPYSLTPGSQKGEVGFVTSDIFS